VLGVNEVIAGNEVGMRERDARAEEPGGVDRQASRSSCSG
jgi:hypothetical protein